MKDRRKLRRKNRRHKQLWMEKELQKIDAVETEEWNKFMGETLFPPNPVATGGG